MTTPEAPPEVALYRIVVCDTCNVVFMVHAGRPSCPSCGGLPLMILYEGEIPTSSNEEPPPTEAEASAPAEVPPSDWRPGQPPYNPGPPLSAETTAAEPAEIGPRAPSEGEGREETPGQVGGASAEGAGDVPTKDKDI